MLYSIWPKICLATNSLVGSKKGFSFSGPTIKTVNAASLQIFNPSEFLSPFHKTLPKSGLQMH